jgi:hypothetical protein
VGSAAVFVLLVALVSRQPAVVALPLLSVSVTLFLSKQFSVSLSRFPLSLLFSFFLFSLRIPPLNLSFASLLLQNFAPRLCPVIFPYIYRMSRERVTIPVQVQGMVAWDGSCAAAAGHGLLFVMVRGMGLLFLH